MATKQWPSLPEWASAGTKVEPTAAKKTAGWVGGGEKPPYQTFNWWQDNVFENINYIKSVIDPHSSLQSAIESATVDGSVLSISPRFVQTTYAPPLERDYEINVGNISALGGFQNVSPDGRYICARTASDTISIYNQGDLVLFATIVIGGGIVIEAFSSNGYKIAISHSGQIDRYDIETQVLDWTYVHEPAAQITSVYQFNEGAVMLAGAAAAGGGASPATANIVTVTKAGALIPTAVAVAGGGGLISQMDWWNSHVAYYDATNDTLGMLWLNPATLSLDAIWSTVLPGATPSCSALAINSKGIAAAGLENLLAPPHVNHVRVFALGGDGAGGGLLLGEDVSFDTTVPFTNGFSLTCDEERYYATAASGAGPGILSSIIAYDLVPEMTGSALTRSYEINFDASVAPGEPRSITTDFQSLYVLHEDASGTDEIIYQYGMGIGPSWWNISNRVDGPVRQAAYPMRLR
tara:strand:- start:92 stop:1486 length:1395 start_codon:yes stop_codon:yes gene_type:complete